MEARVLPVRVLAESEGLSLRWFNIRTGSVELDPNSTDFGPTRADLGRRRSNLRGDRPRCGRFREDVADLGQIWPLSVDTAPNLVDLGPTVFQSSFARVRPDFFV